MATTAAVSSNHGQSPNFTLSDSKPEISKLHNSISAVNGTIGDQSSSHRHDSVAQTNCSVQVKQEQMDANTASSSGDKMCTSRTQASDDDDDVPLLLRKRKPDNSQAQENGHGAKKHSSASASPSKPKSEKSSHATSSSKSAPPVKIKIAKPTVIESDDEDDKPLSDRTAKLKASTAKNSSDRKEPEKNDERVKKEKKRKKREESDDEDFTPKKKVKVDPSSSKSSEKHDKHEKKKKDSKHQSKNPTSSASESGSPPKKRTKKEDGEQEVWRWWEEQKHGEGIKWKFLQHKGPVFAPPYDPLPDDVKFFYDGKQMKLSIESEEVATFYGKMLDHEYTTKEAFNKNFFKDWRKVMTAKERETITDLSKCGFEQINEYFKKLSEERKNMSKEEKQKLKEEKDDVQKEYGVAVVDGHKEKIGNFRIEPPGLFRGRGTHPKMGMLKKRVMPEDVIINCSKDSKVPVPPPGRKWKEVRHDNTVTWLASWTENIMGSIKYIMLNPSSKIKGEKDWAKYETARKLNRSVDKIRHQYREDWKSKEMKVRQRAVALYFIDKLALRAGNEKEEGETADTVGCCSLRCEHIKLYDELDGQECVVEFDFLGKDSIRYYNRVPVEKRVFKNLKLFMENKDGGDDLFDRLNTTIVNKYLQSLMDGLTAKVFRTYNASHTLQEQLALLTKPEMTAAEKLLAYNRANRQVAILCNHQRAVPKAHGKQMENLQAKIKEKEDAVKAAKKELKAAKSDYKANKNEKNKKALEQKQRQYDRVQEQLQKLQLRATDKEENKEIALGTSKLNYLDPRISVAWCKKFDVPIEKIYNKTQREKFRWAIDMAGPDFVF